MRRIFTVFNICVIVAAFLAGLAIMKYEDRYGVLTVTQRQITENEEKLSPDLPASEGRLNINTATSEELMKLPGIGEKLAERIIEYRAENGTFSVPEDIMRVSGIGKSTYSDISDFICVN